MNTDTSDTILIQELQKCNPEALVWIEKKYKKRVIVWAMRTLGVPKDLAQELWTEVLIAVYEMFCLRKAVLSVQLYTLLCTIMENKYLTYLYQQQRRSIPVLPEFETEQEQLKKEAIEQWARQTLLQIDERCRFMLYLRYFETMKYDMIAQILEYANGDTVRNLIARCRSFFREQFPLDPDNLPDYDPLGDA